ncbi:MAG: hypothetical protein KDI37_04345 [Xanthomonadales bacterium]|nr:hypothetical protein [Xanthomonadales bacterium]
MSRPHSPFEDLEPVRYRIQPLPEAIAVGVVVFAAIFFTTYFIYARALDAQKSEIRQSLLRTASVVRTLVDPAEHARFKAPEDEFTPEYAAAIAPLVAAKQADPQITYLYTAILGEDGKVYFIYDVTPTPTDPAIEDTSVGVMEEYTEALDNPDIMTALREQTTVVSDEFYFDQWCKDGCISGYVPLFADDGSERGRFYGVLGLDIQSPEYFQRLEPIKRATVRAMVTGFFVAFLTASMIWFLRNFILVVNERRFKLYRRANAELQQRAQAGLYPQP